MYVCQLRAKNESRQKRGARSESSVRYGSASEEKAGAADDGAPMVAARDVTNALGERNRHAGGRAKTSARNVKAGRRNKRAERPKMDKFQMLDSASDEEDDDDDEATDDDEDEAPGAPSAEHIPSVRTINTTDLFNVKRCSDDDAAVDDGSGNDEGGVSYASDDDNGGGGDKGEHGKESVPIPFHVSTSRGVDNAFLQRDELRKRVCAQSGNTALARLMMLRHGEMSKKISASTVKHENNCAIDEQRQQFGRGVQSLAEGLGDGAAAATDDITRAELLSALVAENEKHATETTIRTQSEAVEVPVRRRVVEEEHLREPYYDGEFACSEGERCQGRYVTGDGDGFTLVAYDALAKSRNGETGGGLCVLCSRLAEQLRYTKSASRNAAYAENRMPDLMPAYQNLVGENEYSVTQVYQFQSKSIKGLMWPVAIMSRLHFRRKPRRMPDGKVVRAYAQSTVKPMHTPFQDGRA